MWVCGCGCGFVGVWMCGCGRMDVWVKDAQQLKGEKDGAIATQCDAT